jgi:F0F1-type ATP synthase epsilon subunit
MIQKSFPLKLIRPISETTLEINWISIETAAGNRMIQKGHIPIIARLQPNKELTYETREQKTESMTLPGGIAHITRTGVTIIVDE